MTLPDRTSDFHDDTPEIPFSYIVVIHEDYTASPPDPEIAEDYWESIDEPDFPVFADPGQLSTSETPYDGNGMPGKCVLSPRMEILECDVGHGYDDWAYDVIREHAAE